MQVTVVPVFLFFLGRNPAIVFLAENQLQAPVVKQSANTDSDIAILSRHHCPRDPMRLPSACATSVLFRERYQFSRGFSLRGEKRLYLEVSWRFFVFKSF